MTLTWSSPKTIFSATENGFTSKMLIDHADSVLERIHSVYGS